DAEIISQLGWRMGWRMIRGSSTRGGTGAFQRMVTALRKPGEVVAMTPDGPKGPRQKAKQGAVRTAMRTGAVIVPVSGQATRRWNVVNWDTFVVPKPLGKVVLVFGNPMDVYSGGPESSRALEEKLNSVQDMADAIAVDKA
ncbi:MAG: DUF374 domain-containing protein, partial [Fidelibacterota bacterium]